MVAGRLILNDSRRFRIQAVIDEFSRECLGSYTLTLAANQNSTAMKT